MKFIMPAVLSALLILGASATYALEPVTVIFDHGHGQMFLFTRGGELQLSGMTRLFNDEGYSLKVAPGKATPHMLSYADVFIISGPFVPYTKEEADALYDFVNEGGRLAIMSHITATLKEVLDRFGVTSSNGVIKEKAGIIGGKNSDFLVTRLARHPLTEGLEGFAVYGAWGVGAGRDDIKVVATTSAGGWEDLDRDDSHGPTERAGPFGMVVAGRVGKGEFVVFGDDAIFQNKFLKSDNLVLAANLVKWLKQ